jgi:hypothetical protein
MVPNTAPVAAPIAAPFPAGRRRSRRRGGCGRRGRIEAGLLHRPHVAVRAVLLLLLLALPFLGIEVWLRRRGRGDEAGGEHNRDGKAAGSGS